MAADHLAENVMHFGRVLRQAGLPLGTDRLLLALQALRQGGLSRREDFKATLAATLVDRAEHRALFEQAFHVFWRDPDLLGRVMAMLLPRAEGRASAPPPPENRRLAEALFPQTPPGAAPPPPPAEQRLDFDAALSVSERELLRRKDFETMSPAEWQAARRLLARLGPQLLERRPSRRGRPAPRGRLDWPATLRAQARQDLAPPHWRRPRERLAPLVLLADISGSMERYSRMLLHLAHGLANPQPRPARLPRIHCFVFGTRLTPIGRLLRQRDPDLALAAVSQRVADWSGGTRLAASLHAFNRDWARRVLTSDATVLLISDGLESGSEADPHCELLALEARRLRLSCRRLLWLNPLLRFDGFEPRAAGIRALLPEVSRHLPAHNLASLEALVELLCN